MTFLDVVKHLRIQRLAIPLKKESSMITFVVKCPDGKGLQAEEAMNWIGSYYTASLNIEAPRAVKHPWLSALQGRSPGDSRHRGIFFMYKSEEFNGKISGGIGQYGSVSP